MKVRFNLDGIEGLCVDNPQRPAIANGEKFVFNDGDVFDVTEHALDGRFHFAIVQTPVGHVAVHLAESEALFTADAYG